MTVPLRNHRRDTGLAQEIDALRHLLRRPGQSRSVLLVEHHLDLGPSYQTDDGAGPVTAYEAAVAPPPNGIPG